MCLNVELSTQRFIGNMLFVKILVNLRSQVRRLGKYLKHTERRAVIFNSGSQ